MATVEIVGHDTMPNDLSSPLGDLIRRYMDDKLAENLVPMLQYSFALRARELSVAAELAKRQVHKRAFDFMKQHTSVDIGFVALFLYYRRALQLDRCIAARLSD